MENTEFVLCLECGGINSQKLPSQGCVIDRLHLGTGPHADPVAPRPRGVWVCWLVWSEVECGWFNVVRTGSYCTTCTRWTMKKIEVKIVASQNSKRQRW